MKKILTLLLFITVAISANSQELCKVFDDFIKIIPDSVKNSNKASYGIRIIDKKGNIICENYVNKNVQFTPASTIKVLIAMKILQLIDEGKLNFDTKITINQPNANEDGGGVRYSRGVIRTIKELLTDMIEESNNIASNQLIDIATKEKINKLADDLNANNTRLYRKVYDFISGEINKYKNSTTAYDLAQIYTEISTGERKILSEESRMFLIDLLGNTTINNKINADFPSNIKFYHRTGSTSKRSADAGFFYLSGHIANQSVYSGPISLTRIS